METETFNATAFLFDVGNVLRTKRDEKGNIVFISPIGNPALSFDSNLTVLFRFYDGTSHVYVLDTGYGDVSVLGTEEQLELQENVRDLSATFSVPTVPGVARKSIPAELYDELAWLGIIPNETRAANAGKSDYSKHTIQPWTIWQEYGLNPWDADIVKRVLRRKEGDSRRMDYEKIIHVCQECIRQIDSQYRRK